MIQADWNDNKNRFVRDTKAQFTMHKISELTEREIAIRNKLSEFTEVKSPRNLGGIKNLNVISLDNTDA
jgi:hypothetical protein